jgi:hypothetical protein
MLMVSGLILLSPKIKIHLPLLSDFEPKGEIAKRYGLYRNQDGITERALFVRHLGNYTIELCFPIGVNLGDEGILKALESITVSEPKI